MNFKFWFPKEAEEMEVLKELPKRQEIYIDAIERNLSDRLCKLQKITEELVKFKSLSDLRFRAIDSSIADMFGVANPKPKTKSKK